MMYVLWLNLLCGLILVLNGNGSVNAAAIAAQPHVESSASQLAVTEAQRVINSIPLADRGYFVTYHMTLEADAQGRKDVEVIPGYERIPDQKYAEFLLITVPHNFARNLLAWAEQDMVRTSNRLLSRIGFNRGLLVCFPSGCVDPIDIGSNCCPF